MTDWEAAPKRIADAWKQLVSELREGLENEDTGDCLSGKFEFGEMLPCCQQPMVRIVFPRIEMTVAMDVDETPDMRDDMLKDALKLRLRDELGQVADQIVEILTELSK